VKIGLNVGYWEAGPPAGVGELVRVADSLGFDSVWTAEAYGADAFTPLAWWGSRTTGLRLGTAVAQISARTPAATAMTAITMDHLTGGRFVLGLGASGPQVVEGWHGMPYARPLERTREYVEIVRAVIARSAPLCYQGEHYQIPVRDGTGLGKPLRSIVHPLRDRIPIHLAAEGPRNVELAAEIADGWIPFFFDPDADDTYRHQLDSGFSRRTSSDSGSASNVQFEVTAPVFVAIDDDVTAAIDRLRPAFALYIGGMGARSANFHRNVFDRMGYGDAVEVVARHYSRGDRQRAQDAVPHEVIDRCALVGSTRRIADTIRNRWEPTVVDTIAVTATSHEAIRIAKALALKP
jgi:F420-dependent oxidoreductase-like protein